MQMYDFLIVGAGLFGATFAYKARLAGKKCLVIDRRNHIGGNCYTEDADGITVHKYGAHIFHTSDRKLWEFINGFATFTPFVNSPLANYKGKLYSLPFNMNTFNQLWHVTSPKAAKEKIASQIVACENPRTAEEQALSLVGKDIYEKLIKGYTEKQWGKSPDKLPAEIIRRLPLRFTYDNNYFNDVYQGIPQGRYTAVVEKMLQGVEVRLGVEFCANKEELEALADKVVFTGAIDEYYAYCYGQLEYRSLRFETRRLKSENYQGNAVINFTSNEVPYTRVIEHKHFTRGVNGTHTIVTWEYPKPCIMGDEKYYPVNAVRNDLMYNKYRRLAEGQDKVVFGGRLGLYKYLDMDDTVSEALKLSEKLLTVESI